MEYGSRSLSAEAQRLTGPQADGQTLPNTFILTTPGLTTAISNDPTLPGEPLVHSRRRYWESCWQAFFLIV